MVTWACARMPWQCFTCKQSFGNGILSTGEIWRREVHVLTSTWAWQLVVGCPTFFKLESWPRCKCPKQGSFWTCLGMRLLPKQCPMILWWPCRMHWYIACFNCGSQFRSSGCQDWPFSCLHIPGSWCFWLTQMKRRVCFKVSKPFELSAASH